MGRDARDFWRSVKKAEQADGAAPRALDLEQWPRLLLRCLGNAAEPAPVERVLRGGGDWDVPGMEDNVYPGFADPDAVREAWATLRRLDQEAVTDEFGGALPGPQWEAWAREQVRRVWAFFEAAAGAGDGVVRIAG